VGKNNEEVTINEVTDYPFGDMITFELNTKKDVAFPLQLRVPSWCKEATLELNNKEIKKAKGGELITLDRTWKNGDKLQLRLPMTVRVTGWGRNSRAVERGPLVYALKLEEKWEKGHNDAEGDYFSIFPKGEWNYGLVSSELHNPEDSIEV
jgi:DUF1680 family protein